MLRRGNRGDDVRRLQEQLRALGADLPTPATEFFGPLTDAAVRKFQREHGLDDDGIVGPDTERALARALEIPRVAAANGVAPASAPAMPVERASGPLSYDSGNVLNGFGEMVPIDRSYLSPEVVRRARDGWVMVMVAKEAGTSATAGGDQYRGGLYFINVDTNEVRHYPVVGGGRVSGSDSELRRYGPTPGALTDLYHGDRDGSINAIYGGVSVQRNHRYGTVVRLDEDPLDSRGGILIHRLFNANTRGCVGVDGRDAMDEIARNVRQTGVRQLIVLNPEMVRQQSLTYAEASQPDSGFTPNRPPQTLLGLIAGMFRS